MSNPNLVYVSLTSVAEVVFAVTAAAVFMLIVVALMLRDGQ